MGKCEPWERQNENTGHLALQTKHINYTGWRLCWRICSVVKKSCWCVTVSFNSRLWVQSGFSALDGRADPEHSSSGFGTHGILLPRPCCWLHFSSCTYSAWSLVREYSYSKWNGPLLLVFMSWFFFFSELWKAFENNEGICFGLQSQVMSDCCTLRARI